MNKNLFIAIVLGIDALTIGTFGTAAYESGRPIVGVIFLFVLVILSGIAFGFVLNQDDVEKPMPKINETDYTRIGVAIMKQTVEALEKERASGNTCPHGLCIFLKKGLSQELNVDYNKITESQMHMAFPFFTYNNAKTYGGATNLKTLFWWNEEEISPRIEFLKIMIKWQEEL